MAQARSARAINRTRYGPRTRLVRGLSTIHWRVTIMKKIIVTYPFPMPGKLEKARKRLEDLENNINTVQKQYINVYNILIPFNTV